ncbi:hypothetical protein BASA81_004499 [Batrachochytrium salamandrivorans]|nr:hypothetical protein BASA81_004499 [Batrachochytrium salamandrivorans]
MRLSFVVLLLLLLACGVVLAHGGHSTKSPTLPKENGGDSEHGAGEHDDGHDDDKKMSHMGGSTSPEEQARKKELILLLHVAIASVVVFCTLPISVALVAKKKFEYHRQLSGLNTLALLFAGAMAILGFSDGDSFHSGMGVFALVCLCLQSGFGILKQYMLTGLNMQYHRFLGLIVFAVLHVTWWTGFYHIANCNDSLNALQICNAHFFLVEMLIIALASISELVGEGIGDAVLVSQNPNFEWDWFTKLAHLGTAFVWLAAVMVGLLLARKWPSSLPRGWALILGSSIHMVLLFVHDHEANSLTPNAHRLHEFALLPLVFARYMQWRRLSCFLLLVAGIAFASAAEPVAELMQGTFNVFAYLTTLVALAVATQAVHVGIHTQILTKRHQTSTMFSRSGWDRVVRILCCVGVCCPSLLAMDEETPQTPSSATVEDEYQATVLVNSEDNEEEDEDDVSPRKLSEKEEAPESKA